MLNITKQLEIKEQIENIDKEIKDLNKRKLTLTEILLATCPHPTIKITKKYYEGGYDYVSSVGITETCTVCEKVMAKYADPDYKGTYA